jgi:lycopene cyclase domain-containing protein
VTYLALNLTVLLSLLVVLNLFMRNTRWPLIWLTGVVLFVLTALFDNLIILSGTVDYDPEKILGMTVGIAPIEDFAYTIASVFLVPALWLIFSRTTKSKGQE